MAVETQLNRPIHRLFVIYLCVLNCSDILLKQLVPAFHSTFSPSPQTSRITSAPIRDQRKHTAVLQSILIYKWILCGGKEVAFTGVIVICYLSYSSSPPPYGLSLEVLLLFSCSQLFVDKDTIMNAVSASHDTHLLKIDNKVSPRIHLIFVFQQFNQTGRKLMI